MAVSIGDVLDGKYRVVRIVGEGGMGTVYEGEYARIRRRVAIKVLNPIANAEEIITRFEREAQAAGRIGNEHILEVYDLGTLPGGAPYMVTEFLEGTTLAQRIASHGQLSVPAVARIAQQILVALEAAHGARIIHRDLKPDNVFVLFHKAGKKDFVKLIDFGISKFETAVDGTTLRVTRFGALLGTPTYMSPEIARGASEADVRTDIYGVGVIMYEALAGRLPFEGNNLNDLLFNIVEGKAPELHTLVTDLDPEIEGMVTRAMAKNPADRYASAAEFLAVLTEWMALRGIGPVPASSPSQPSIETFRAPVTQQPPATRISAGAGTPVDRSVPHGTRPTGPHLTPPTLESQRVASGATNDSIARAWSGTQAVKGSGLTRIALGVAFAAVLGGIGAFTLLRKQAVGSTPAAASSSQHTTALSEPSPLADAMAPAARSSSDGINPPTSATSSATATRPSTPFLPTRPAVVASSVPVVKAAATSSSASKAPKAPDDEIPGMR